MDILNAIAGVGLEELTVITSLFYSMIGEDEIQPALNNSPNLKKFTLIQQCRVFKKINLRFDKQTGLNEASILDWTGNVKILAQSFKKCTMKQTYDSKSKPVERLGVVCGLREFVQGTPLSAHLPTPLSEKMDIDNFLTF